MSDTAKSEKPKKKRVWVQDAAIYSALRRAFRSSPAVTEILNLGKEVYYIESKKGKKLRRVRFLCADCKQQFSRKKIFVDHIMPIVDPLDGNILPSGKRDWNKQIDRMGVSSKGLQLLCKVCHNRKSKEENSIRRKIKKEKENGR